MAASRKPSPSRPVCGRLRGAARRFFAVLLPCVPVAAVIALGLSLIGAADRTGVDKTVLIAELCAKNLTGLADCDGQRGDWLELVNLSGRDLDLSGWHLSNSARDPEKYTFPEGYVIPGEGSISVILWADGQDRVDGEDALHLNFSLNGGGWNADSERTRGAGGGPPGLPRAGMGHQLRPPRHQRGRDRIFCLPHPGPAEFLCLSGDLEHRGADHRGGVQRRARAV